MCNAKTQYIINLEGNKYNIVGFPLKNKDVETVEHLMKALNQSIPYYISIFVWDASNQEWVNPDKNSQLIPVIGYCIYSEKDKTITISGDKLGSATYTLYPDFNLICWCFDKIKASQLYKKIPDVVRIYKTSQSMNSTYNPQQLLESNFISYPEVDFNINFGDVVWIQRCSDAEVYYFTYGVRDISGFIFALISLITIAIMFFTAIVIINKKIHP